MPTAVAGILNGVGGESISDGVQLSGINCFLTTYTLCGASSAIPCDCTCPANYFYHSYPSGSKSTVVGCICNAGYFASSSYICQPCPFGSYSTVSFQSPDYSRVTACTTCGPGKYGDILAASFCSSCVAGTYSYDFGLEHSWMCKACPVGTYWTGTGAYSPSSCSGCAPGTYSTATGVPNSAVCVGCPQGTYNSATGFSVCTLCPSGSYNNVGSAVSTAACSLCIPGKYSTASGSMYEGACLSCNQGYYSGSHGSSACSTCLPGTFSASLQSSACGTCSRSSFNTGLGKTACDLCKVTSCPSGQTLQSCSPTSEGLCTSCTLYPNCDYRDISGCFRDGGGSTPSCSCAPGFQMDDNSALNNNNNRKCVECPYGAWKGLQNYDTCKPWTTESALQCGQGKLFVQGTRTKDSMCVDFSASVPDYAVIQPGGVEWVCMEGYEKI